MKIEYEKDFGKDLNALRGTPHQARILLLVTEQIPEMESIESIPNCRPVESGSYHFRIRIGNYRIGFRLEEDLVIFMRVRHRKDFYRVWP